MKCNVSLKWFFAIFVFFFAFSLFAEEEIHYDDGTAHWAYPNGG